jgi:hypothetical protein
MENKHYQSIRRPVRVLLAAALIITAAIAGLRAQNMKMEVAPGKKQVVVSWSESAPVDSIAVTGGRTIAAEPEAFLTSPLTIDGLTDGQLYAFEIYFHPTEWPTVDVGVLYAVPGEPVAPRNLKAAGGHNEVVLSWEPPVEGKDYSYKVISTSGEKRSVGSATSCTVPAAATDAEAESWRVVAVQTFDIFPGMEKESWKQASVAGSTAFVKTLPLMAAETGLKVSSTDGIINITVDEASDIDIFTAGGQSYRKVHAGVGTTSVPAAKGFYFVGAKGKTPVKVYVKH